MRIYSNNTSVWVNGLSNTELYEGLKKGLDEASEALGGGPLYISIQTWDENCDDNNIVDGSIHITRRALAFKADSRTEISYSGALK